MINVQDELTLQEVYDGFVWNKRTVISITVAGLLVGLILSIILFQHYEANKKYSTEVSFVINSKDLLDSYTDGNESPSLNDVVLSQTLVDTAQFLVKSEKMYLEVTKRIASDISYASYKNSISLSQVESTQIIVIKITSTSSTEAVLIGNEISKVLPIQMRETMDIGDISTIDVPVSATPINGPSSTLLIMSGLLIGVIASIAWLVINTISKPVISRVSDIHRTLGIDLVVEVPEQSLWEKQEFLSVKKGFASLPFMKNFGTLSAIFKVNSISEKNKCVMVTSTQEGEGKTTIVVNLAFSMLANGYRILVIDCDIRQPILGKILKTSHHSNKTLNRVLKGEISLSSAIIESSFGLHVIQSVPDTELLITSDLNAQIKGLFDKYDYIFIDTPPLGMFSDALDLSECVDSGILVIRQAFTQVGLIRDMTDNLEKAKIPIMGAVLNNVRQSKEKDKYYQRYYQQSQGFIYAEMERRGDNMTDYMNVS